MEELLDGSEGMGEGLDRTVGVQRKMMNEKW